MLYFLFREMVDQARSRALSLSLLALGLPSLIEFENAASKAHWHLANIEIDRGERQKGRRKRTYKSQHRNRQRTNRMNHRPQPMHIKIPYPRPQIPNKIPRRKALHHAARASIPPQTLPRGHDLPLMIQHEHYYRERVDDARLHQ